jgi:hypothetical protein
MLPIASRGAAFEIADRNGLRASRTVGRRQ